MVCGSLISLLGCRVGTGLWCSEMLGTPCHKCSFLEKLPFGGKGISSSSVVKKVPVQSMWKLVFQKKKNYFFMGRDMQVLF